MEMLQMLLTRDIEDLGAILPELPEQLRRFILKACALLPADRYVAVEHVLEDLRPLAKEYGITGEPLQSKRHNISTMSLVYGDEHLSALKHLMADFSSKAKKMGFKMNITDNETE